MMGAPKRWRRRVVAGYSRLLARASLAFLLACTSTHKDPDQPAADTHVTVLPTGKLLDPAGRAIRVGNMPLSIAMAPGGRYAVVLLSRWREQGLQVVDLATGSLPTIPQERAF